MADITETDYTTDPPTVTERDFTPEELAQREADAAEYARVEAERVKAEADAKTARDAAVEHAKSLGFTDVMIAQIFSELTY